MGVIDRIKMASSILVGGGAATSGTLADFIGGTMTGRQRTPKELLDAYSQLPWLHATANKVSMSVASTTWRVYRPTSTPEGARSTPQREKAIKLRAKVDREVNRADNPLARTKAIKRLLTEGEIEEVDNHPILDLLYDGNDFMTGSTVRQLTQVYQDVVGEAFLMYERGAGGVPIALLPVPRTWVEKIATPDQPTYIISHDSYREEFDASEIVYFQAPNLRDPYGRGVGTAAALNDELATDEYAAKHTRKWFENSARPDLIVTGPGLEKAETRRLENKWRAKFQGFKNSFAPAFLSTEVKIHELNQTFQSMQLRELREFERDTIIQVYGVPPEILGIVENSNRATIEAADYLYGRWVVAPRCEYTREVLQVRVMDVEFDGAILAYDSPVAEDKTHQLEVAKAAPYSLKIDEWREMMGLEPLDNDEGQVFMMPFNLVPQTSPALVPSTPDPIAPPDDEEDPDDVDDDDDDDQADDDETTDDDEAVVEETARGGRTKRDEGDGTLTEEDVLLLASMIEGEALVAELVPYLREAMVEFGQRALDEVDPDRDFVTSPNVETYLATNAATRIRGVTETTREALRDTLVDGVREGESIPKLAGRVEEVFDEAGSYRSTVIARTEVVGASNGGAMEGYRQGGVPGKEWLETADNRTRDAHIEIGGQRRQLDQDFDNSLGSGPCPGQMGGGGANNIQCRCTILPVIDFEQDSIGGETRKAYWRAFDRERAPHERRVTSGCKRVFADQRGQVLAQLAEMGRERSVARV